VTAEVDDAVKTVVKEQMTSDVDDAEREFSGFSVQANATELASKTIAARYQDNLGTALEKWAAAYDFDWWVVADCPAATFEFRIGAPVRGSDKSSSVIFTVNRHNILSLENWQDGINAKSLVYAGGWGEGQHQDINKVHDGAEPTGWDRREIYITVNNAETADEVDMVGHSWLDAYGGTLEGVRFTLTAAEAAKWPDTFDIGDTVRVYDTDWGIDSAVEIQEICLRVDEAGQETVEVTVGQRKPSLLELERREKPEQAKEQPQPQHEHGGGVDAPNIPVTHVTPEPYHPANGGSAHVPGPGDLDPPGSPATHTHAFAADVTGTSAAGGTHLHTFAASVTGTSAAGSSHNHSVSADVTGTSGAGSSHNHSFSASVTGTSAAESSHTHNVVLDLEGTSGAAADPVNFAYASDVIGSDGSVGTSVVDGHYHEVYTTSLTVCADGHTHGNGSYYVSGPSAAGSAHSHGAGTFAVSGNTGNESSHTHGDGSYAVSGTTGAESSHTHAAGTFAVSGNTGYHYGHTHGDGSYAVSGTTDAL